MLLSMTGFGHGVEERQGVHVVTELKSVNNRYLKLSIRLPDSAARYESDLEKLIRSRISRGAVQVSVRVRYDSGAAGYRIDAGVLQAYRRQLAELSGAGQGETPQDLMSLLNLPGVIQEDDLSEDILQGVWPAMQASMQVALEHFADFRHREGESMKVDLKLQCDLIAEQLLVVQGYAEGITAEYRERLLERVRKAVAEVDGGAALKDSDVIREVALFADRCDINEEITRLRSHIEQFQRLLESETSQGRKLEFIGQEMFREINTIGSKANDVRISMCVVEMKAAIERIREILQNVE
jgi:uncharacterized protein (TIGR00255 family)